MLEYNLRVKKSGEIGSHYWRYAVDSILGSNCIASAGGVDASAVDGHYILSSSCRQEIFGIEEGDNARGADSRLRKKLHSQVTKFIDENKDTFRISIEDEGRVLGDLPQTLT